MNKLAPCLLVVFASASCLQAEEKLYLAASETKALVAKEGQKVVVHGETEGSGKSASGTNFVNFKGSEFSLVTFKSDLGQFPDGEPADAYDGRRLAAEGAISIYRGKPQIKLTDPAQVTILEADAVFPPPQEKKEEPRATSQPMTEKPAAKSETAPPEEPKRKPPVDASEYFKKR